MIPGLENAEIERFGQMHRNAFIASPMLLEDSLAFQKHPGLFVAGQLAGIEGYAGNIASGLVAGINAARFIQNLSPIVLPKTCMIGALLNYITHADAKVFQPMKAMFGLMPKPNDNQKRSKAARYDFYMQRALQDLDLFISHSDLV